SLGCCLKDWTNRDVVDRQAQRSLDLFDAVSRMADDGVRAKDSSRCFRRHVVLAEMNTVRAHSLSYVHSVVDDQLDPARHRRPGLLVKLQRRCLLLAKLNESRAAETQAPDLFGV